MDVLVDENRVAIIEKVIENGRLLIPIRPVAEALGAEVLWDDATKTATLQRAGKEIKLILSLKI